MRTKQELTYLEVVRPVEGAGEFLARARKLADLIFNSEDVVPLQVSDADLVGEDGPLILWAGKPIVKIFSGMRLPLLERITIPETRSGSKFASAMRQLKNGRETRPEKGQPLNPDMPRYEVLPIEDEMWHIQLKHDFPNANRVEIMLDRVNERFVNEVTNGDIELTLGLAIADPASRMLREQARKCAEKLGKISRSVAYPTGYQSLEVPFGQISEQADAKQVRKFIGSIEEHLPLSLAVGAPQSLSRNTY